MTDIKTAARMALDALERCVATCFDRYAHEQVMSRPEHFVNQAITAIREALAEQPAKQRHIAYVCPQCHWTLEEQPAQKQEPVGQLMEEAYGRGQVLWFDKPDDLSMLYTSPQRKPWVGLTLDEKHALNDALNLNGRFAVIDTIEAKLKEKNT